MYITQSTDYGIRALLEVASEEKTSMSRGTISERQGIPLPFLTQVLRNLVKAGLMISIRGPSGGYALARLPGSISLLEVITALQGSVAPMACLHDAHPKKCDFLQVCGVAEVWEEIKKADENILGKTNLQDLLNRERAKKEIREQKV